MKTIELKKKIEAGLYDEVLSDLYPNLNSQKTRYTGAIDKFIDLYGDKDVEVFSAPGRTEVGGNHTDHQLGKVLAAAINLDAIGIVSKRDDNIINIVSDNFNIAPIDVLKLEKRVEEEESSEALIRGMCYCLKENGYIVKGFDAFVTSEVLLGAGMSSSACFEVLIGVIISNLYNNNSINPVHIAQYAQFAENVYFNKPCGLMDQCASSVGGLITIDFKDKENPKVRKLDVDFSKFNHVLCIVDTNGSHADLTYEYAAIPQEMKDVAKFFNKDVLSEVSEEEFYNNIKKIRESVSDRGVLRAHHLFEENKRVELEVAALEANDFNKFKEVLKDSGRSSFCFLQNIYNSKKIEVQDVSLALALSERILKDRGVCRVHGGGFAGTIQAFVESDFALEYKKEIEKTFGLGSCHILQIRKYGGKKVI
ncbi:MAG: galactokinase [Anaerorhabdus sp.]